MCLTGYERGTSMPRALDIAVRSRRLSSFGQLQGTGMQPVYDQKAESAVLPPTLDDSLDLLTDMVTKCREERTFESAVEACTASRAAWAAYYDEWIARSGGGLENEQQRLDEGLAGCVQVMETVKFGGADADLERDRVGKYARSIAFRTEMLQLLHNSGIEAVQVAIRVRRAELLAEK